MSDARSVDEVLRRAAATLNDLHQMSEQARNLSCGDPDADEDLRNTLQIFEAVLLDWTARLAARHGKIRTQTDPVTISE